jgi:hypothetical protein
MRKIKLSLVGLAALLTTGVIAQPIHDNAVIPVGITVNTVLRLNVVRGGNIEFVFNTISQFKTGIGGAGASVKPYQTEFKVSASQPWKVCYGAENNSFIGEMNNTNIELDNVGHYVLGIGTYTYGAGALRLTGYSLADAAGGVAATQKLLPYGVGAQTLVDWSSPAANLSTNGGDDVNNDYVIYWRCGTGEGTMEQTSFISKIYQDGRYATNVFLVLAKH